MLETVSLTQGSEMLKARIGTINRREENVVENKRSNVETRLSAEE